MLFLTHLLQAQNLPKGWPWKGIDIMAYAVNSDPQALQFIIDNKIKYVRIHFHKKKVMQDYNVNGHEALNLNLKWAKEINNKLSLSGIESFITLADFPISLKECINKKDVSYWKNKACIEQMYFDVNKTVQYFKNSTILGYEFLGEPVVMKNKKAFQPENWRTVFKNFINITRKIDKNKWLFYSPGPLGLPTAYNKVTPFNDLRIIYNAHMYLPHKYTHQNIEIHENSYVYPGYLRFKKWDKEALEKSFLPLIKFQKKYNKPISISEFSVVLWADGSEKYIEDLINIFNKYQWSWIYFNIGELYKGWDARFDAKLDKLRKKNYTYRGEKSKRFSTLKKYFIVNKKDNNATSYSRE